MDSWIDLFRHLQDLCKEKGMPLPMDLVHYSTKELKAFIQEQEGA